MALVQMKSLDVFITEGTKHSYAADPEDRFLTKAIMLVATVEKMCERAVPFRIFREIGVQTGLVMDEGGIAFAGMGIDAAHINNDAGSRPA